LERLVTVKDFPLPDLGEGLTESEIVSWHVGVGDTVQLNQVIAEIETAKALVELPSPFAGTVTKLYAEPGTTVRVGAPIVAFEIDTVDAGATDPVSVSDSGEHLDGTESPATTEARQPMLVGRGPAADSADRPRRRERRLPASTRSEPGAAQQAAVASTETERPRSTPPVRALARELGIELADIAGTGENGLITREDVTAFAAGAGSTPSPATRRTRDERVRRVPIAGVRKRTAEAMSASAFTAPHVTEFLTADVTASTALVAELASRRAFGDTKPTLLTIVAKALCLAVRRTPVVNARWDEQAGEILEFGYIDLGIAVATERGLFVPNVKDADALSLPDLAAAVARLASDARAGRTAPADLTGGTITITNIGVFGIDTGTPIINPPEAAILAMGAVRRQPWEHHGEIALRDVMTLSLSFDHRLVDGEQGARVLRDVAAILGDPGATLALL